MRYRKLTTTGDYSFGHKTNDFFVNTSAAVAQAVQTALKLIQGEWFLDNTAGVPYFTQILGYNTQSLYDAAIKQAISSVQGFAGFVSYSSSLNTVTRQLTINVTINTIFTNQPVTTTTTVSFQGGYGVGGYGAQAGYGL